MSGKTRLSPQIRRTIVSLKRGGTLSQTRWVSEAEGRGGYQIASATFDTLTNRGFIRFKRPGGYELTPAGDAAVED